MGEVALTLLPLLEREAEMLVEHDPEWTSPCEILPPNVDGMVHWHPALMDPPAIFDGITLHPDLREFYGSFWGRGGSGRHSGETVSVQIAWNSDDLVRITRGITTEVAAGVPVYVAGTGSDWYFGVDNTTGTVWLCEPGYPPIRQVAPSLATFLVEMQTHQG